jgi:hypothetical protein
LFTYEIKVPNVQLYEGVEVHLIPDLLRQIMDIRLWWNDQMVHPVTYPLQEFPVHFRFKRVYFSTVPSSAAFHQGIPMSGGSYAV